MRIVLWINIVGIYTYHILLKKFVVATTRLLFEKKKEKEKKAGIWYNIYIVILVLLYIYYNIYIYIYITILKIKILVRTFFFVYEINKKSDNYC